MIDLPETVTVFGISCPLGTNFVGWTAYICEADDENDDPKNIAIEIHRVPEGVEPGGWHGEAQFHGITVQYDGGYDMSLSIHGVTAATPEEVARKLEQRAREIAAALQKAAL